MKKKNFVKKLVLNKKTVSNLDGSAMNGIYGHKKEIGSGNFFFPSSK